MSDVDPDAAAREFSRLVSSRKPSTGIPRPPSIEVNETAIDVNPINFDLGSPGDSRAFPGGGGGGPPPPGSCRPSSPATFTIRFQAISLYGFSPGVDVTRNFYTLDNMPYCNDFFPPCPTDAPVEWQRSFSPEYCAAYGCDPGCAPFDPCLEDWDTGDWCEARSQGPWEVHVVLVGGACIYGFVIFNTVMRYGTVNGQFGWHAFVRAEGDVASDCTSGSCPSQNWPGPFIFESVNQYLGLTLNGSFSGLSVNWRCPPGNFPNAWQFIWTFSSP